jgi:hypothetical protein
MKGMDFEKTKLVDLKEGVRIPAKRWSDEFGVLKQNSITPLSNTDYRGSHIDASAASDTIRC